MAKAAPRADVVSLGCPKALADSERILTKLRAGGYETTGAGDDGLFGRPSAGPATAATS